MGIKEKLISFDSFASLFQLSILGSNSQYKTLTGALFTISIHLSASIYLIYLLYIWGSDQIVPVIASENKFRSEGNTFYLSSTPFYANYEAYDNASYNSAIGKRLYQIENFYYLNGDSYDFPYHNSNCSVDKNVFFMDLFDPICLEPEDQYQQKITQNYSMRFYDDYLGYYMIPCNETVDLNCIKESELQSFTEQMSGDGRITTFTQEYDLQSHKLVTIPFDFYFSIRLNEISDLNLYITLTKLELSRGIIFPNIKEYEYISKIEIKHQTMERFEGEPYARIWVSLARVEKLVRIEYPRLPEILSQFSSILATLYLLGAIFSYIHNKSMKIELIKQIGELYFFNYEEIVKNTSKLKNDPQIEKKKMYLKNIEEQLFEKYNVLNLIYEISRIQLALQTLLTRDHISKIQYMKYSLPNFHKQDFLEIDSIFSLTVENFRQFSKNYYSKKMVFFQLPLMKEDEIFYHINNVILNNLKEPIESNQSSIRDSVKVSINSFAHKKMQKLKATMLKH